MIPDLSHYLLPIIVVSLVILAIAIATTWVVIFTATRAALRSWSDERDEMNASTRFGLPRR